MAGDESGGGYCRNITLNHHEDIVSLWKLCLFSFVLHLYMIWCCLEVLNEVVCWFACVGINIVLNLNC